MLDHTSWRLAGAVLCGWCIVSGGTAGQTDRPDAADDSAAASLALKLAAVIGRATEGGETPHETRLTEAEVNAYLTSGITLPGGVTGPVIELTGDGRATGRATVDLDRVREGRQGGWLDPTSYLTGRLPVAATGVLHTVDGVARVEIEQVEIGGVPVPASLLREVVATFTKSADHPDGVDVDGDHPLPYGIREIQIHPGEVRIFQ